MPDLVVFSGPARDRFEAMVRHRVELHIRKVLGLLPPSEPSNEPASPLHYGETDSP